MKLIFFSLSRNFFGESFFFASLFFVMQREGSSKRSWDTNLDTIITKRGKIWSELSSTKQATLLKLLKRGRMETSMTIKKKPKHNIQSRKRASRELTNTDVLSELNDNADELSDMFKEVCVKQCCHEPTNQSKKEETKMKEVEEEEAKVKEETESKNPIDQQKLYLQLLTTLLSTAPFAEQFLSMQFNAKFDEMSNAEKNNTDIGTLINDYVIELTQSTSQLKKMISMFERLVNMMNHELDASIAIQFEIFNK